MNNLKCILLITLPTLFVLILMLELFFRFVIPASNPPGGFFDEHEMMYSFPNDRKEGMITGGRFAETKAQWRINNMRWNYPIDYTQPEDKKLITVIGDSYIEAFQVDKDKNYPYLLRNELYPDYEVFAFGKSGASFSQYLHMSRYVNKHFDPDVLIFNIIHNDFFESVKELHPERHYFLQLSYNEDKDTFVETTPTPDHSIAQYTAWKKWMHKSALVRYLYMNISFPTFKHNARKQFEANIDPDGVQSQKDLIYKATNYIIGTIREENNDKRVIFIMDAPRSAIYDDTLGGSKVWWMHELMQELCAHHQVEFLDLTKPMKLDFEKNNKKFNSDTDGHWDSYGHQFVAKTLKNYLTDNKQLTSK